MNQYLHEAYECLITKLKENIDELNAKMDERYCADNTAISMLLDFVLEHHGPQVTRTLAEEIDEAGGYEVADYLRDKMEEKGIEP
jgi:hypothetical protein